jgi:hypothetical protein
LNPPRNGMLYLNKKKKNGKTRYSNKFIQHFKNYLRIKKIIKKLKVKLIKEKSQI